MSESAVGWLPDGHGLAPLCVELVEEHGLPVHLRLTNVNTRSVKGACGEGLGELWSGRTDEVNCPNCKEWIHA